MQIVIDIPEKVIREEDYIGFFKCLSPKLYEVITNGKPLPAGHGKLIDVSNLLTVTDIREDGTESTYVPYEEIEDAPTIIEAESEE